MKGPGRIFVFVSEPIEGSMPRSQTYVNSRTAKSGIRDILRGVCELSIVQVISDHISVKPLQFHIGKGAARERMPNSE